MEAGVEVVREQAVVQFQTPGVRRAGFTLIELLVTFTIVAILAAIAYPAYQDHMRKGRRAAAQAFLVETGSRQQQYLLDARRYAVGDGAIAALNLTVPGEVAPFYSVTVEPAVATNPPTYRILATPIAGSAQVVDGGLTLDHDGNKSRNGNPGW
jgi:type IV pilus assembly protein PilE